MSVGAGLYMYVVVVQKFTFAISSPDEFLFLTWNHGLTPMHSLVEFICRAAALIGLHLTLATPAMWCQYQGHELEISIGPARARNQQHTKYAGISYARKCNCVIVTIAPLRSLYAVARPSVSVSVVCRLSVCNVRAPYSGGSNFRQYFYGIRYLGHPLTSTENFMEIVQGEPLRRGS